MGNLIISDVPMITQDQTLSCWYASTQMVIQWRRNRNQMTEARFRDPSEIPAAVALYATNSILPWTGAIAFARALGLEYVPLMSPTLRAIESWLNNYGPIWAAGLKKRPGASYGHAFVIVGIDGDFLHIHDPEPAALKGGRQKVGMDWLATLLSIGSNPAIQTNFLHYPG
jgi:hypothetical protein